MMYPSVGARMLAGLSLCTAVVALNLLRHPRKRMRSEPIVSVRILHEAGAWKDST